MSTTPTTTPQAAESGPFYCPEHKFNPEPGSPFKFCPDCEFEEDEPLDSECSPEPKPPLGAPPRASEAKTQDDSEILRIRIGSSDPLSGPTARVLLPLLSMPRIARILRQSLTMIALCFDETDEDVQSAYELAVWIDILEGTVRMVAESEREKLFDVHGGV